jgi:predicted RNase H-like HicB family nuclease
MKNQFTAVFEKDDKWWVGYVEELPGANTQGATLDEARENLKEAVAMVLEANRELAERDITGKDVVKEELVIEG